MSYTLPKTYSPMYNFKRIPRKLKKKVKTYCGINWNGINNNQRMWYYLEKDNLDYKLFLIENI